MNAKRNWIGIAATSLIAFATCTLFALPARSQSGDVLFKAKCAACHGADGKGETAVGKADKIRDLGSPDVQKQTDDELSGIISAGKGKTMPAYGKSLKPEQIKDLVAAIRALAKK